MSTIVRFAGLLLTLSSATVLGISATHLHSLSRSPSPFFTLTYRDHHGDVTCGWETDARGKVVNARTETSEYDETWELTWDGWQNWSDRLLSATAGAPDRAGAHVEFHWGLYQRFDADGHMLGRTLDQHAVYIPSGYEFLYLYFGWPARALIANGWESLPDGTFHKNVRVMIDPTPCSSSLLYDVEDVTLNDHGIPVRYEHSVGGRLHQLYEVTSVSYR
jgi:hypothetical protein